MRHVLRWNPRDPLYIFNEMEGEWQAQWCSKTNVLHPLQLHRTCKDALPRWHCFFSLCKSYRWIVEKLTELGIYALHPVLTQHSSLRNISLPRLIALGQSAAEQCGRLSCPKIMPLVPLPQAMETFSGPMVRFDQVSHPKPVSHLDIFSSSFQNLGFLVGPEGGWSPKETIWGQALSLGPTILRADTAAVAGFSHLLSWQRYQAPGDVT